MNEKITSIHSLVCVLFLIEHWHVFPGGVCGDTPPVRRGHCRQRRGAAAAAGDMAYGAPGGGVPAPPPPAAALATSLHHPRLGQAPLLRYVRHGRSAGGPGNHFTLPPFFSYITIDKFLNSERR